MESDKNVTELMIPEMALVVLIGPKSSEKSTFAKKHFDASQIISIDSIRSIIASEATDDDAFDVVEIIAAKRLAKGLLTVIDGLDMGSDKRQRLISLARKFHRPPVAVLFDTKQSLDKIHQEKWKFIHEPVENASIHYIPLECNKRHEEGPFDIIGDIHGCFDELKELILKLGYILSENRISHPKGRKAIFLGDLTDRGPDSPGVLKLVMQMVSSESALCILGNHDVKLMRKLQGKDVVIAHGLDKTLEQLASCSPEFRNQVQSFYKNCPCHYVLDQGELVVAHAGLKKHYHGGESKTVTAFALYGATTGKLDENNLPKRSNWAKKYDGEALVVYGHTPIINSEWLNNTINIDNGCVFGGQLTALRYPEKNLVSVQAKKAYADHATFLPVEEINNV